ncbi:uncharacterized protein LOC134255513 [Saccostrea cucullata]|uniref:uncharacterized protein LOC134255513 n=1 Tax=Saccostrea cuccullata TaxID=36930 RepID=UPI002ED68ECF
MPTCCCTPGCSTRGGLQFPKDKKLRKLWVLAIKRNSAEYRYKHWCPQPHSVVCHKHFREDDFIPVTSHGTDPLKKQREAQAVPSIFPWSNKQENDERSERRAARSVKTEEERQTEEPVDILMDVDDEFYTVNVEETIGEPSTDESHLAEAEEKDVSYAESSTQTFPTPLMSVEDFIHDSEGIMFYTGLASHLDFLFVLLLVDLYRTFPPAYGGSTSDRQVVERSPLINICDPGDLIMSDKGFNVQDLFAPKDVKERK